MIVAVLILGAYAYTSINQPGWVFRGAYANFYGQGTMDGVQYTYNMTFHVPLYNNTAAHVIIQSSLQSASASIQNNTDTWIYFLREPNPFARGTPSGNYSSSLVLEGKKVGVNAYVYNVRENDLVALSTQFVNKCGVPFPVGFDLVFNNGQILHVLLVKTNIPGLLPSLPFNSITSSCP